MSCFILKTRFGILKFAKMAEKLKMASETKIFVIFLSKLQFSTDFKNLDCVRSFRKKTFSKIQNGGFFEDDVIFGDKSTFFQQGRSHPKLNFFQILKRNSLVQIPKKIAKENFQRWRRYARWRLDYFLKICHVKVLQKTRLYFIIDQKCKKNQSKQKPEH
jgi:hypothetical protein